LHIAKHAIGIQNVFLFKKSSIKFLENNATLKGPSCVFWQHRNFGQVCVIGDFNILG